jgi:hypothetical protein
MEGVLVAVMYSGPFLLVGGSIALVGFAFLRRGPRRLQLGGLAFRAAGLGLGSIWVAYGLLLLTAPPAFPGSFIALCLTVAGAIAIWVSLRTPQPLG